MMTGLLKDLEQASDCRRKSLRVIQSIVIKFAIVYLQLQ
jgi:hypothetical protein